MNGIVRGFDGLPELAPAATMSRADTDSAVWQARLLMSAQLNFHPYVFSGHEFPPLACDNRDLEELVGPHTIETTFYDRDYNIVTSADEPGRYGAVIGIIPTHGRTIQRFRTLFRQSENIFWGGTYIAASIALPVETGLDASVLSTQGRVVSNYLKSQFMRGLHREPDSAVLMAGLHETSPEDGPASVSNDVWARDRQWWLGLKRRLHKLDTQFPEPFVAPRLIDATPSNTDLFPVLRDGSAEAAGMEPDVVEQLDQLLRTWAADTDQAFAVCLARRGVVFFHRAYGTRNGQPMTVETGSWMASITKLLAGTLLMMLVDQERVSLDEPVDTYLPALRGIPVEKPLTLRHLMTHTAGLWGHLGDEMNDFEHIVADYCPLLNVGRSYEYNGASFALAGKVIEAVSGEALPQFFRRHLLDPLGMQQTDVTTMSWDTFSIPLDIARVGQMLLNRGAYGKLRFFSESTFEHILPQPLTSILGPDATEEYGMGTSWFKEAGLSAGTFGHGAASAATLRIDPGQELVIVMSRNAAGANFESYHPQFLELIGHAVADVAGEQGVRPILVSLPST